MKKILFSILFVVGVYWVSGLLQPETKHEYKVGTVWTVWYSDWGYRADWIDNQKVVILEVKNGQVLFAELVKEYIEFASVPTGFDIEPINYFKSHSIYQKEINREELQEIINSWKETPPNTVERHLWAEYN